ncbi:MAG: acetolactate decarboxylase [Alphaproteobacteria bacterium]
MKKKYYSTFNHSAKKLIILLLIGITGCSTYRNTVTQFSTIDALLAGAYDGEMTCGQLLDYGNFGLGTFDKLDGEMIVLDGKVYQIKFSGKVCEPENYLKTPFAAVCNFECNKTISLTSSYNLVSLKRELDKTIPDQNLFYAIKITGTFDYIKARSVPKQKKPYPPLAEIVTHQAIFEFKNIEGTIVGFRCPPFVKGINVPHYHLHFINDDKTKGGHILDLDFSNCTAHIDILNKFFMILPEKEGKLQDIDLSINRANELEKVEK